MPGLVGKTLDTYRLVEQIGQGGMATVFRGWLTKEDGQDESTAVYRATDAGERQQVAIKVLSPTIASDKRFVRRFRREAGLLFRLRHPNIVPVTDYGEAGGFVYLVMPFVQGETLHERLIQRKVSIHDLSKWIGQVADALQFAHDQGVIHRDIKPANIMISRTGNALLTDFGLARLVEGSASLTGSMLMGTPAYVSPEQGKGQKLDARSDQYALGVILYQVAAGRLPFEAETPMGTVLLHIQEPVPPIRMFNKEVSPALERVLAKALAKDPEGRFPSVAALNAAYQAALTGGAEAGRQATQVITGARRGAPSRVMAPRRFGSRLGWAIIAVLVVGVLGLAAALAWPALNGASTPSSPATEAAPVSPPATLPVAAVLPSPSPVPAPVPTAVVSPTCPDLQLIGFQRSGAEATWTIDNATPNDLYLVASPIEWKTDNPLKEVRMGNGRILPPPGQVIGGDVNFTVPRDERTTIAAGSAKAFTLVFEWADTEPLLSFQLIFTGGCELSVGS
ncbi:MAG: serine/threonine protein kinase [Anaerolineales bacterium]|nr:serine/threonine protein kinase [Anaerolineales bacterium]